MDAAVFTLRSKTKTNVQEDVENLALTKNASGSYTHEDAQIFRDEIKTILARQYFHAEDGTNGMEGLLADGRTAENELTRMKSTDMTTRLKVLAASRAAATAAGATKPDIESNSDAQDEADRQNMYLLAVIGAKEGVAAGIATIVGKAITDPVLRTADASTLKNVDDYSLYDLIKAMVEGADRPATQDVRKKFTGIIATNFDFRTKIVTCVEVLNSKLEKMATYGITIGEPIVVMIILAEVEEAAKWCPELRIALTAIRARYTYSHTHDATSLTYILEKLAIADESRDRRIAPAPAAAAAGEANAAEGQLAALTNMIADYEIEGEDSEANTVIENNWMTTSRKQEA